jgi:hypothetical protein
MTTQEAAQKRWNINLNLDTLDTLVLGVLIGLFAGAVITSWRFHVIASDISADWWDSILQNTGTEMFGAFLTFALIEVMLRKRRERDAEEERERREAAAKELAIEQEKERLILQMGSPDNAFAVEAARILKARGWGFKDDTTLHGANLRRANLQGARLFEANLRGAYLFEANLRGADLQLVNLQGAYLWLVNLQAAHLLEANLQGANLVEVEFDKATTLPDGTKWTSGTEMARFTDPDHPNFWRSDDPDSPAYRGKDDD